MRVCPEKCGGWQEYKKQLVSGVVWEMRAKRANPSGTGATFGRSLPGPLSTRHCQGPCSPPTLPCLESRPSHLP